MFVEIVEVACWRLFSQLSTGLPGFDQSLWERSQTLLT
ncbi:hypothetical protein RAM_22140 [Amycolatopsis mediterranei S699]|uniref:Uncharacterized protein n=1 Tax=Amycolatopsis mediterranei (strain S699) TaxID=713604 RepID=A0A9R0NYD5_AMYMS|nr:hypothetical protein RAM_22140 [Amycolatopsis mediterranei S699]